MKLHCCLGYLQTSIRKIDLFIWLSILSWQVSWTLVFDRCHEMHLSLAISLIFTHSLARLAIFLAMLQR